MIFIAGMHRSGTSLVARLLHKMGANFANDDTELLDATDANPMGYFERRDVMEINDEILAHFKGKWHYPPNLKDKNLPTELTEKLQKITSKIASQPNPTIKDPRLCITLPFWLKFTPNANIVIIWRDSRQVVDSLMRRDGLPSSLAFALWEFYNVFLLNNSLLQKRIALNYNELVANPPKIIEEIYHNLENVFGDLNSTFPKNIPSSKLKTEINAKLNRSLPENLPYAENVKLSATLLNLNSQNKKLKVSKFSLKELSAAKKNYRNYEKIIASNRKAIDFARKELREYQIFAKAELAKANEAYELRRAKNAVTPPNN